MGSFSQAFEYDHADAYQDLSALKAAFSRLIKLLPEKGILVFNLDDPNLRER